MKEESSETKFPDPTIAPTAAPEPTKPAPIPLNTSEPDVMSPEAPEALGEAESAIPVNNGSGSQPTPTPVIEPLTLVATTKQSLLSRAREMIQFRKRKKLQKIMEQFMKQVSITNDEVEKLLHISDATAKRYLQQLEKEGKIKQSEKTGKSVSYSRI